MGVSCLVASEDVAIKIRLFSKHICTLVPKILFPHMPLWPGQGWPYISLDTLCHVVSHAESLHVSFGKLLFISTWNTTEFITVIFLRIQIFWGVKLCGWAGNSGILRVCNALILWSCSSRRLILRMTALWSFRTAGQVAQWHSVVYQKTFILTCFGIKNQPDTV